MQVLVTGGAGLVGSALCNDLLQRGAKVFCVDNLVLGSRRHVEGFARHPDFEFETWDVSKPEWHAKLRGRNFDLVVHLAANSDISLGHSNPEIDFERTTTTTFETLRAARDLGVPNFVFSSSSAVYGAHPKFPTPEASAEMHPVSLYGAGKLASEAFVSAFCENYKMRGWVFRFGNVVGEKLTHGVIFDFVRKLKANPASLQVLGDGRQSKTYIDVDDCVRGILCAYERSRDGAFQVFNLSTSGSTLVREIAEETAKVVTGGKTKIQYQQAAIGWVGDVPKTSLEIEKISALGWKPNLDSTSAVVQAISRHYQWTMGSGTSAMEAP